MATQEFYVRGATETEARGPFQHEQLVSLAENGQIDAATLYYDTATEQWLAFSSNLELMAQIFPEKKKLKMGKKEIKSLNETSESAPPISVDEMLAAAEGKTADTKGKQALAIDAGRAAKIGTWAALLALLASAAGFLLPSFDRLLAQDFLGLLQNQPLAYLGLVDLAFAGLLGLQVITIYPLIRFRAMAGLGMVGFLLWSQGQIASSLPLIVGSVGLYFCTICISYLGVGLSALGAVGGLAGYAWFMIQ
jgi:hypothetical protein